MTDFFFPLLDAVILGQHFSVWLGFFGLIALLLFIDLGVMNRKDRVIGTKESLIATGFYVFLACVFGGWLWSDMGQDHGVDYFTAYFIELSLSLDNLFVMSLILGYFSIPRKYQHRVLFGGIVGVLVMRAIMIGSGIIIVEKFHWMLYVFAAFLIFTGLKMLFANQKKIVQK